MNLEKNLARQDGTVAIANYHDLGGYDDGLLLIERHDLASCPWSAWLTDE